MNLKVYELLKKYCTARIDIKNYGDNNSIIIMSSTDLNSRISEPENFNISGGGVVIESCEGILDLKIKCINEGSLKIWLRSPYIKDINNQKFPIFIDYINFSVNNQEIINNNTLIWHDEPYIFSKEVIDSEIVHIHLEWLPFNEFSKINIENFMESPQSLKRELSLRETQINSIPQLSNTTLGTRALNGKLVYRNWAANLPGRTLMKDLDGFCENIWFTRYLKHKFPNETFNINFFGVSNAHDNLAYPMYGKKVLYSVEDLNYRYLEMKCHFNRYALDYVDLAMGYDFVDNPKYLRFPFWIIRHFSPESTAEEIENKISAWNSLSYEKSRNVVGIASHDWAGTRTLIVNDINKFIDITFAGKWRNNTSELWDKYNNNKSEFIKQFKFNLCAENLLDDAYVTEKIFDAIDGDCIPLYAGGGNYLEPKVINPNAIIRWDANEQFGFDSKLNEKAYMGINAVQYPVTWVADEGQNSDAIELFKNIISDKKTYDEFKDQDKLLDSSAKFLINKFSELEKHFERLIYS